MGDRETLVLVLVGPDPEDACLFEICKYSDGIIGYRVNDEDVSRDVYELCMRSAEAHVGFPDEELTS
jgi:hypothetical protein